MIGKGIQRKFTFHYMLFVLLNFIQCACTAYSKYECRIKLINFKVIFKNLKTDFGLF